MRESYKDFIASKHVRFDASGFTASEIPADLFDWQKTIVNWCCKKGRSAIFADCGLGKTAMQLAWADQVVKKTGKSVLLLAPISVGPQTVKEAKKFQIDTPVKCVKDQSEIGSSGIYITNYQRIEKFDCESFGGVVLDESSILKSFTGKIKQQLCNKFAGTKYKLACTATAAPNDHMELGNHSEFLGVMRSNEMLCRFFFNDTMNAGGYRICGHAEKDFWLWVSSWAVCVSMPSDVGGDDDGFELPKLIMNRHIVEDKSIPSGYLFKPEAVQVSATNVHKLKRQALKEKVAIVAEIVNARDEPFTIWCDTNYEADALMKSIEDAVEVRGSTPDDKKEDRLNGFSEGRYKRIISKPEIAGFGMNWQHCHNTTYFAGFSFERWYQSIRRHLRFGQTENVNVHLIASDLELPVIETLERKAKDYQAMQSAMSDAMREGMQIELFGRELTKYEPSKEIELPNWLTKKELQNAM